MSTARSARGKPASQVAIGKNAVGEDCTQSASTGDSASIYCGTWEEPSAHVRCRRRGLAARNFVQLATASPWRTAIDTRFRCEQPTSTTILGNDQAELIQCTRLVRRLGACGDRLPRSAARSGTATACCPPPASWNALIGVLAGVMKPDAVPVSSASADALLASRLAAQAFSSGDVGQYDELMTAGTRANLADNTGVPPKPRSAPHSRCSRNCSARTIRTPRRR